jgi:hypothetical protein
VFTDEPFGMARVGSGQHVGTGVAHALGSSIVDINGVLVADPAVVVLVVVPGEQPLAERSGVGEAAEAVGEVGPVLQRLELGFGVRVVVFDMGPGVVLVTPRSASRNATGLEAIDEPLSACTVS